jgi:hypothetical protein
MPLGPLVTPAFILVLAVAVPFVYTYVWPRGVVRVPLFLVITVVLALITGACLLVWFLQGLVGVGITRAGAATAARSEVIEAQLRVRFIEAIAAVVVLEFLVCRGIQMLVAR